MSDRRRFLLGAGAAVLATTLAEPAVVFPNPHLAVYAGGLVSNRALSGVWGKVLLTVTLAVEHGAGFCTLSDPMHPKVNSHIEISEGTLHGNAFQFEGEVILSNDPAWVGQPLWIGATVEGNLTRLVLTLGGKTFSGLAAIAVPNFITY